MQASGKVFECQIARLFTLLSRRAQSADGIPCTVRMSWRISIGYANNSSSRIYLAVTSGPRRENKEDKHRHHDPPPGHRFLARS